MRLRKVRVGVAVILARLALARGGRLSRQACHIDHLRPRLLPGEALAKSQHAAAICGHEQEMPMAKAGRTPGPLEPVLVQLTAAHGATKHATPKWWLRLRLRMPLRLRLPLRLPRRRERNKRSRATSRTRT